LAPFDGAEPDPVNRIRRVSFVSELTSRMLIGGAVKIGLPTLPAQVSTFPLRTQPARAGEAPETLSARSPKAARL
jgi:hypothetical protein